MRPADLPTHETMAFLARVLPPSPARLLEVGCGHGDVAAKLAKAGYEVTAIDASADAVAAARGNGVEAIHTAFSAFDAKPFDAVLFTRSLHHIHPLGPALDHARRLLSPRGIVVLEELAVEGMDAPTALWFYDACAMLEAAGAMGIDKDDLGRVERDPLSRWRAEHAHEGDPLHTGRAMREAAAARFSIVVTEAAPYLFRTICAGVESSTRGARAAEKFLALEKDRIERGLVPAIGFRIVATAKAA